MELENETEFSTITGQAGDVGFLWQRYGVLKLYNSKLELFQAKLADARYIHRQYVRNCEGQRRALSRVVELKILISMEESGTELSYEEYKRRITK